MWAQLSFLQGARAAGGMGVLPVCSKPETHGRDTRATSENSRTNRLAMKRATARLAAEQPTAPRSKRSDFELNTVATRPTASSRQNEICREKHLRGPLVCFNWSRRFANRCRSFELADGR